MPESGHNGRSITLRSGLQKDGTWVCDYTILEIGSTRSSRVTRSRHVSFSTRGAAEAAAIEAAQAEIDSRGALS